MPEISDIHSLLESEFYYAKLSNGLMMPKIGLGTWEVNQSPICEDTIRTALHLGYRHIDTAFIYRNEKLISKVLSEVLIKEQDEKEQVGINNKKEEVTSNNNNTLKLLRKDLFITSKLPPTKVHSEEIIRECFEESLKDLGIDYLDCYLIHWPGTSKVPVTSVKNKENRLSTWRVLEKLYKEGKVKSIGVSNFNFKHLTELIEDIKQRGEDGIMPHVNQVEYHLLLYKTHSKLEKLCKENNIVIQAYSPLAHGEILRFKDVVNIKESLQWILEKGHVILPRSVKKEHLELNFNSFKEWVLLKNEQQEIFNEERLKVLNNLVQFEIRVCWDPDQIA
ncbi:hypothetical protein ABK040_004495 [Willaertia magna]